MNDKEIYNRAAGRRQEEHTEQEEESIIPTWVYIGVGFMVVIFFCIMGYVIVAVR